MPPTAAASLPAAKQRQGDAISGAARKSNGVVLRPDHFFHPSWPVIYADNHLLALFKPAGLLVQGDRTGDPSLLALAKRWIKETCGKPGNVFLGMVHRLDRPVAGVVLFCRTSKAAARISEQFRSGGIRKRYLAVVEGRLTEPQGRLIHFIQRRPGRSSHIVPGPSTGAKEARLFFRVRDARPDRSLLEIDLETGRHHQIRLQLAHIGHPIVGDLRYGAAAPLENRQLALLAGQLVVTHPTRGETIALVSPFPRGWPWPTAPDTHQGPSWSWEEIKSLLPAAAGENVPWG